MCYEKKQKALRFGRFASCVPNDKPGYFRWDGKKMWCIFQRENLHFVERVAGQREERGSENVCMKVSWASEKCIDHQVGRSLVLTGNRIIRPWWIIDIEMPPTVQKKHLMSVEEPIRIAVCAPVLTSEPLRFIILHLLVGIETHNDDPWLMTRDANSVLQPG